MKFSKSAPLNILFIIFLGIIIGIFLTETNPELKTIGFASSPAGKNLQARNIPVNELTVSTAHSCELHGGYCDLSGCLLSDDEIELTQGTQFCSNGALCCARIYRVGSQPQTESINGINVTMRIAQENGYLQYTDLSVQGTVKRISTSLLNQQLYFGGCNVQVYSNTWSGDPPIFVYSLIRVWNCTQLGAPICGNGVMETGEQCDGTQLLTDQCRLFGFDSGTITCNNNCTLNTNVCTAICGNGQLAPTEQCDDGGLCSNNTTVCTSDAFCSYYGANPPCTKRNGDGCNAQCETEYCGDGIINNAINGIVSETCDDEDQQNGDGCNSACQLEYCGDGTINNNNSEECDDGNNANNDGCNSACDIEVSVCGNGIIENGEQCDDNNTNNWDGCNSICQIEVPVCGNNHIEQGEQCDDGNTINGDGCSSACQTEQTGNLCGNGVMETGEQCDGTNLGVYGNGVNRCTQYNDPLFDGGNLTCFPNSDIYSRDCTINYLACTGPLHADFKVFKRTSVVPEKWMEVNLLTEDIEFGAKYRLDGTYSVGEAIELFEIGTTPDNVQALGVPLFGPFYADRKLGGITGQTPDFFHIYGQYLLKLGVYDSTGANYTETTKNMTITSFDLLSSMPFNTAAINAQQTAISGNYLWAISSTKIAAVNISDPNNLPPFAYLEDISLPQTKLKANNNNVILQKVNSIKIYTNNPGNFNLLYEITPQQLGIGSFIGTEVVGDYLYFTTFENPNIKKLRVFNISNPSSPQEVTSLVVPTEVSGLNKLGSKALAFNSQSGLRVIDIRNQANPILLPPQPGIQIQASQSIAGDYRIAWEWPPGINFVDVVVPDNPSEPITFSQTYEIDYNDPNIFQYPPAIPDDQFALGYGNVQLVDKFRLYMQYNSGLSSGIIKFDVTDPNNAYIIEQRRNNGPANEIFTGILVPIYTEPNKSTLGRILLIGHENYGFRAYK